MNNGELMMVLGFFGNTLVIVFFGDKVDWVIYRLILILGTCSLVSAPLNPSGCDDVVMLASICSYGHVFAELHFHGWGVLGIILGGGV